VSLPPNTIIVRPDYTPGEHRAINVAKRTELLLRIYNTLISSEERELYREKIKQWQTDTAEMEKRDQETRNRIAYRQLPEPVRKLTSTTLQNTA